MGGRGGKPQFPGGKPRHSDMETLLDMVPWTGKPAGAPRVPPTPCTTPCPMPSQAAHCRRHRCPGGQRGRRPAGCPRAGALGGGRLISMPGFAAAAAPQSAPGQRHTDAGSAEGSAVCVQSRVPGLLAPTSSHRQLPAGPCPQNLGGEVAWGPAGQGRAVAVEGRAGPPRPRSPQSGLQFATCCRTSLVKKGCLH